MGVATVTPRDTNTPARVSFNNIPAGATTSKFVLPPGFGEMQLFAADPNNPGICTLQDGSGNTIVTVNTSVGALPSFTGSVYFETPGGVFQVNVTQNASEVKIHFQDQQVP